MIPVVCLKCRTILGHYTEHEITIGPVTVRRRITYHCSKPGCKGYGTWSPEPPRRKTPRKAITV